MSPIPTFAQPSVQSIIFEPGYLLLKPTENCNAGPYQSKNNDRKLDNVRILNSDLPSAVPPSAFN